MSHRDVIKSALLELKATGKPVFINYEDFPTMMPASIWQYLYRIAHEVDMRGKFSRKTEQGGLLLFLKGNAESTTGRVPAFWRNLKDKITVYKNGEKVVASPFWQEAEKYFKEIEQGLYSSIIVTTAKPTDLAMLCDNPIPKTIKLTQVEEGTLIELNQQIPESP